MLLSTSLICVTFAGQIAAAPIDWSSNPPSVGATKRQSITTPLGINITDLDLGDISPIEDGFLELDNDAGGETENGGTAVSNANGYAGSVGSGQSAQNPNGVEGTSAACSLTGCATSAAAANNQSTSTSSSSSGLINAPLVGGSVIGGNVLGAPILNGPLVNLSPRVLLRRLFWT